MGLSHSPKIVTTGLVGYWDAGSSKSYPGSGTTWYDISGKGNHGTLINGPTYSEGAISFDAVDDYVSCPASSNYAFGTGNFTISVWVYPQSFSGYTHMVAFPNKNTFVIKAARTGDGVAGSIYFYSTAFNTSDSTPGWTLTLNTWQQVVLKRESSVAYAFLNSELKGSKSGFNNDFSTAPQLNIHNSFAGANEFSQCKMSNIKVYNRALSSQEIKQNFNALRGRFGI